MNFRPLTLTALSCIVMCLTLVGTASAASQKRMAISELHATTGTPGSSLQNGSGVKEAPTAHVSRRDSACGDDDVLAGDSSASRQARTTVCLLNRERTSRGLRPLRLNNRLSDAAEAHNRDMVANRYFAHESRSGGSTVDRIRRTGYMRTARSWMVGENLAWGSGSRSTPAAIVSAWMHSPGHRRNILTARFREIGIGIAFRAPISVGGAAVTYTTEFGARN